MEKDAQTPSQSKWGTENVQLDSLPGGQGGIQKTGSIYGDVFLAVSRFNWSGESQSILACLLGGILRQLLESERQRLNEVKECVVWYEREQKIVEARVKEIEQLQQLTHQVSSEPDESNKLETTTEEE